MRKVRKHQPVQLDLFGNPLEPYRSPKQEVALFEFEGETQVRAVSINGEPWWVAADVCRVLGLKNPTNILATRVDPDERGLYEIYATGKSHVVNIVNESGLYSLIFASNKPVANRLRKWVAREVLPAIRKYGFYKVGMEQSRVQKMAKRLKTKDLGRARRRVESVDLNKKSHSRLRALGGGPRDAAEWHNGGYRGLFNVDKQQLVRSLDMKSYQTPLDRMSGLALYVSNHAKAIVERKIEEADRPINAKESALMLERTTREMAQADLARLGPEFCYGICKDSSGQPVIDVVRRAIA